MANGQGTTTTPSEDLRGFTPGAHWKPFVAMEAAVDEPPNRLTTMHAPLYQQTTCHFSHKSMILLRSLAVYHLLGKKKFPSFIAMVILS